MKVNDNCIIEIGRIPRKAKIRKFVNDKVYVSFQIGSHWDKHGFNYEQLKIVITETQSKINFNQ